MDREPLFTHSPHPEFDHFVELINRGRYFKLLSSEILASVLRQGSLVTLKKDHYVIREGSEAPPELYILVEGSLAVLSNEKFILRLDLPGDVVGEVAVIQSTPRLADVLTETDCRLIVFPHELFHVDGAADQASVLYVLFSHILAAKLRITTAQSMIRKNTRVTSQGNIRVGIVDSNAADRSIINQAVEESWPEATVTEFADTPAFVDYNHTDRFDLVIADTQMFGDTQRDWNLTATFIKSVQFHGAQIVIASACCNNPQDRELLIDMGADELMTKPCASFELNHVIRKSRIWYLKNLELDKVETEAETDRLTGLANRRRLDKFLEALITVYPDSRMPFSLIMTDIDNFKYYNDANGHQLGDLVLRKVATALGNKVRRGDLAARFGGEEFIFVLPDCGKDRAMALAETLRATIESTAFPNQENQPGGNLTMTLGVATYPQDAEDLATLLKKADDCLYVGKDAGRNVVIAANAKAVE